MDIMVEGFFMEMDGGSGFPAWTEEIALTPVGLMAYMNRNIESGYFDASVNAIVTKVVPSVFWKTYRLMSPEETMRRKHGVCWDQSELERVWFEANGYETHVIFVDTDPGVTDNGHTFVVYRDPTSGKLFHFEHSFKAIRGIHPVSDVGEAVRCVIEACVKDDPSRPAVKPVAVEMSAVPRPGCTVMEYFALAKKMQKVKF